MVYSQRHATSMLIGGIVKPKFKNHKRTYSAKEIKDDMKHALGIDLTYMLYWRARKRALEELKGKSAASYNTLSAYLYMLDTTYPGSHIWMKKNSDNEFLYVFISLCAFIKGFEHCRPVFVVDDSHMRGIYIGTYVSASTMDGTGHIFSLAYGVVDSKNNSSWT